MKVTIDDATANERVHRSQKQSQPSNRSPSAPPDGPACHLGEDIGWDRPYGPPGAPGERLGPNRNQQHPHVDGSGPPKPLMVAERTLLMYC